MIGVEADGVAVATVVHSAVHRVAEIVTAKVGQATGAVRQKLGRIARLLFLGKAGSVLRGGGAPLVGAGSGFQFDAAGVDRIDRHIGAVQSQGRSVYNRLERLVFAIGAIEFVVASPPPTGEC